MPLKSDEKDETMTMTPTRGGEISPKIFLTNLGCENENEKHTRKENVRRKEKTKRKTLSLSSFSLLTLTTTTTSTSTSTIYVLSFFEKRRRENFERMKSGA